MQAKLGRRNTALLFETKLNKRHILTKLFKVMYTRYHLIQSLIASRDYKRYLEIGAGSGILFNLIEIEHKDGVDPGIDDQWISNDEAKLGVGYSHIGYSMTSDEFFENHAPNLEKYDIIFIDGLHESHQVDKDIDNALKFLNKGGSIVLHDCNPLDEIAQIVPRIRQMGWNGDVWKSVVKYRASNPELNLISVELPDDADVSVICEGLPKGKSLDLPKELTYQWLDANREQALNLFSLEESKTILNIQ